MEIQIDPHTLERAEERGTNKEEIKVKEELEDTKEILKDKDFLQSIMKGDEDFKAGRFKKWSEVKENV
jgi:hypothetical protein